MALTSHVDQLNHLQIATKIAHENEQIFKAIPVVDKAIKSALRSKNNCKGDCVFVSFALDFLIDADGVVDYLNSQPHVLDAFSRNIVVGNAFQFKIKA